MYSYSQIVKPHYKNTVYGLVPEVIKYSKSLHLAFSRAVFNMQTFASAHE